MKILIVSDTHRQNDNYFKAMEKEKPCDMVIHCGDIEGSEYAISEAAGCRVEMVMGNNDFFSNLPRVREFKVGSHTFFVTHGHDFYVSMGNEILKSEARSRGADVLLYGHTHRPVIEKEAGLTVINPGSLTYPRQEGRRPTYVVMTISEKDEINCELVEL